MRLGQFPRVRRGVVTTLRRRSVGISPPPTATGVDEPMFVAGAMAATSAASVMNAPADAAREPGGAT